MWPQSSAQHEVVRGLLAGRQRRGAGPDRRKPPHAQDLCLLGDKDVIDSADEGVGVILRPRIVGELGFAARIPLRIGAPQCPKALLHAPRLTLALARMRRVDLRQGARRQELVWRGTGLEVPVPGEHQRVAAGKPQSPQTACPRLGGDEASGRPSCSAVCGCNPKGPRPAAPARLALSLRSPQGATSLEEQRRGKVTGDVQQGCRHAAAVAAIRRRRWPLDIVPALALGDALDGDGLQVIPLRREGDANAHVAVELLAVEGVDEVVSPALEERVEGARPVHGALLQANDGATLHHGLQLLQDPLQALGWV
eukprot:CAMPEP_0175472166 /NCGR_PEP_ID=MMETSP0095-20121207/73732_1 /TAXON_ID=311494 /ORGANISM="Alexandrium monilatum, Strain CCMP3105" /LENGTH=309 /DNA_ID=CAMNT_0016773635 /DNA_START=114 /DNA_END=1044 /DNA_ORIENTATION=-